MVLYKKIDFPQDVVELIKNLTIDATVNFNEHFLYTSELRTTTEEWDKINEVFRVRGLSDAAHLLAVKRKVPNTYNYQFSHVDINPISQTLNNATFVIPVYGYENTEHYWFEGGYTLEVSPGTHCAPAFKINWVSEPEILDKFAVTDGVWITNASIPHNVYCIGDGYRLVCSIRLTNNETMEEILEKFGYGTD